MSKTEERQIIQDLIKACETLMDEVVGKKATDWGIVNDALFNAERYLIRRKK